MLRALGRLALCSSLALAASCDGSGKGSDLVAVVFRVHVPASTPPGDHVYLAGDFQGWDPGSPEWVLAEVAPLTFALTRTFPRGTRIELKITRGSWATVEKGSRGEEVPNRVFEVVAPTEFDLTVGSWADQSTSTVVGDVAQTSAPGFLGGRRIWVYLPPGYHQTTDRYPVLYMFDGQNVFDFATSFAGEWKVDETLEALVPAGETSPLLVVAIDHAGSGRIDEYTPWMDAGDGGGGAAHLAAIADVLVPWVDATYRTLGGPGQTGIGGASLGGLMALYAVYARPDVFGLGLAMSPSIWWASLAVVDFAAGSPRPAARVWMDMGTAEYASAIDDLRAMRDAMVAQGFVLGADLVVVEDPGAAHNEAAWSRRFPDAARYLFPPPP
ncbi:MAG TPA: alpha/beta hydrolase-fold protein [Anaeromyxobacteraceae bacterium]|jgi:pullulanase